MACAVGALIFLKLVANHIALMLLRLKRLESQERVAARQRDEREAAIQRKTNAA